MSKTNGSKKGTPSIKIVTSIAFIFLMSLFSCIVGLGSSNEYGHIQSVGIKTIATVVDSYPIPRVGTGYTVKFYTENNQEVIANINNLDGAIIGDKVEILYDPNNPQKIIQVGSTPKSWIGYTMSGIFFTIALILTIILILIQPQKSKAT